MLCGIREKSYVRKYKRIVVLRKDSNGNFKEKTPRQVNVKNIKLKRVQKYIFIS